MEGDGEMRPERFMSLNLLISMVVIFTAMFVAAPVTALDSDVLNSKELVMQVTFPGFDTYSIVAEGESHVFKNDEMSHLYVPGKPVLPVKKYMIALPPGAIASEVEVKREGEVELPGVYRIKPAPEIRLMSGDIAGGAEKMKEEWQRNYNATYTIDEAYPRFEGKLSGFGTLRKYSYASVSVCPFSYQPLSGKLKYYGSARITVKYTIPSEGSEEALKIEEHKRDRVADKRASRLFVNYEEMKGLYEPSGKMSQYKQDNYDYVILTDPSLVSLITSSDFYQWKKDVGHNVMILLNDDPMITGQAGRDLAEQIRNCFKANYLTWGVEHLLIVGDYATIPMRYCFPDPNDHNFDVDDPYTYPGEVPTDYYYADLSLADDISWDSDGDNYYGEYGDDTPDFLADIYVGRIPTSSESRIIYTLNKLVLFGQDTGAWKDQALHPGSILFFENQDYNGYPFCDGARLQYQIETDVMSGWSTSHYSEQEGLQTSLWDWPAISESAFTSDWRNGQYGVVNWSGHGGPHGVGRSIWNWDDGDGVPESHEIYSPYLISVSSSLQDDYPSIVTAVSCLVGYPEPTLYGNLGIDLLCRNFFGAAAGVFSATRPAAVSGEWPTDPGGAESFAYEFNRFMISGPDGSERLGDAVYDGKFYSYYNYGWDHVYEHMNLFNYNLYGDPAMFREGIAMPVVDNADAEFIIRSGSWQSRGYPDSHGGDCLYNPAGSGENSAAWRVDGMITPGRYDVYTWKFDHPNSHLMATNAPYIVRDRDSMSDWILVDQSTSGDEWIYLGSFEFDNSRVQGVMVTDDANGYVVADAIKLVYTGSLP
jgi:hypothetical protein